METNSPCFTIDIMDSGSEAIISMALRTAAICGKVLLAAKFVMHALYSTHSGTVVPRRAYINTVIVWRCFKLRHRVCEGFAIMIID